jgi:diguanylate cyclase (GGDEF)-like protein
MTPSGFTSGEKGADNVALPRAPGRHRWLWPAPVAVIVVLVLLKGLSARHEHEPTSGLLGWVLIAVLASLSWIAPLRLAIGIGVLALSFWSMAEWQLGNVSDLLPDQIARLVVTIGLMASLGWQRSKLALAERLARIDSLTGLPNRQAIIEALEAEISRSRRFGRPFSLAMLDCDGFKLINDRSGHLAGDVVLRRIGDSLRGNTRAFDCAGRWGGDEFLVVLSEVNQLDAEMLAERLRAAIRHDVERDYPMLAFSLGVVTFVDAGRGWQECVKRADEAMYAAKRSGRNATRFEVIE